MHYTHIHSNLYRSETVKALPFSYVKNDSGIKVLPVMNLKICSMFGFFVGKKCVFVSFLEEYVFLSLRGES